MAERSKALRSGRSLLCGRRFESCPVHHFGKMTPEGFEPPAFGFGIQRAAVAPWSHFTCEIASVAQLVERSAVNR